MISWEDRFWRGIRMLSHHHKRHLAIAAGNYEAITGRLPLEKKQMLRSKAGESWTTPFFHQRRQTNTAGTRGV